ncbi:MAG: serine/threonine protein kinase [Anaerolineales bacterium]
MSSLVGKKLDQFLLREQIGQGGMATVFRGENTETGEVVAIKVLSPTISSDRRFVLRFRREGGLVSRLRHPHIIPVTNYGEDEGMIYLAMPFIEGMTLHEHYRQGGLTPKQAGIWLSQVADALHYAHEQGVIHRDVKPANIIIDRDNQAHLGDFGLARWLEGSGSLTGSMLMGTPPYMSPEQARGDKLDSRSDQYSLGVIMFQLFTGRLPFDGDTAMQTAMMHLNDPVPSPRHLNPEISSALERVILTALSKDREARFPTVRALNTAFQAALRGDQLEWLRPTVAVESGDLGSFRAQPSSQPKEQGEKQGGSLLWIALAGGAVLALLGTLTLAPVRQALGFDPGAAPVPTQPLVTEEGSEPPPTDPPATATLAPTPYPPIRSSQCPDLRIFGFQRQGNTVSWQIDNGTDQLLTLENMLEFGAPAENQSVEEIRLGPDVIFTGPAVAGEFNWLEGGNRQLSSGEVLELAIQFAWEAEASGYEMELDFSQGCVLEGSW